jgi:hypothetical protein
MDSGVRLTNCSSHVGQSPADGARPIVTMLSGPDKSTLPNSVRTRQVHTPVRRPTVQPGVIFPRNSGHRVRSDAMF